MSIKPILFNTDMVRAILDGRKTVTRRLIKKSKIEDVLNSPARKENTDIEDKRFVECLVDAPCEIGDILYVSETWQCLNPYSDKEYVYKASCDNDYANDIGKWFPSIHMPKEAARIWLKVFNVRVERLQDISNKEAEREGIICETDNSGMMHRYLFSELWNSTIKKSDIENSRWYANPWVWVIEFERCEKPKEE